MARTQTCRQGRRSRVRIWLEPVFSGSDNLGKEELLRPLHWHSNFSEGLTIFLACIRDRVNPKQLGLSLTFSILRNVLLIYPKDSKTFIQIWAGQRTDNGLFWFSFISLTSRAWDRSATAPLGLLKLCCPFWDLFQAQSLGLFPRLSRVKLEPCLMLKSCSTSLGSIYP